MTTPLLEDLIQAAEPPAPKDFRPGVKFSGRMPDEITTGAIEPVETEAEWEAAVRAMGVYLPEGYGLHLVEAVLAGSTDPAAWHRDVADAKQNISHSAYTAPKTTQRWRYRFKVVLKDPRADHDIAALMREAKKAGRGRPLKARTGGTMVVTPADFQWGKALADETPILTPEGWRQHGEIRPGDEVYSPEGKPVKVLATTGSTLQACSAVSFDSGGTIIASDDHEWDGFFTRKVRSSAYSGYEKVAARLTTAQIKAEQVGSNSFHVRSPEPIQTPEANLPIDPYTLGAWLGDGRANAGWICGLPEDLLEMPLTPWRMRNYTPDGRIRFALVDGLRKALRAAGVFNNKHVPDAYLTASVDQRRALLQGLMDTDGTVSAKGHCSFDNTNQNLAQAVHDLALSLGLKPRIRQSREAGRNGTTHAAVWRVQFSARRADRVFTLPRKADRLREDYSRNEADYRYVSSVDPAGDAMAQCLTVEGGLYLAGKGLVPTHNCDILGGSAETLARSEVALQAKLAEHARLRPARVILADLGDIIEGFESAPNAARTNDLQHTEQVRVARRVFWRWIEAFARVTEDLTVLAVPSNHCRVRQGKNALGTAHDDWGIEILAQVADIAAANETGAYDHVRFVIPNEHEDWILLESGSTLLGFVHGHQKNAPDQVSGYLKTNGRSGVGQADVVLLGHFHHLRVQAFGDGQTFIIAPTNDNGSSWFASSGEKSRAGVLSVVVEDRSWRDLDVTWTS